MAWKISSSEDLHLGRAERERVWSFGVVVKIYDLPYPLVLIVDARVAHKVCGVARIFFHVRIPSCS